MTDDDIDPQDIALACDCGCVSFHLLGDGNIECRNCQTIYGRWRIDEPIH